MKVDKRVIQEKITFNQEEQHILKEALKLERSMTKKYVSKRELVVRALTNYTKSLKRKRRKNS